MSTNSNLRLAGIVVMFTCSAALARPYQIWAPSELLDRSEIVVVGRPTSVKATGKTGTIRLGENPEIPVIFYSAKVEVISTIKGEKVAKGITIIFSTVDPVKTPVLKNGPTRFWLKEGKLFLLYLKKGDEDAYVGALDGDFDDGQASSLLSNSNTEQGVANQRPAAVKSQPK
jgi:hypothetical protein